jgi:hypothetical protein
MPSKPKTSCLQKLLVSAVLFVVSSVAGGVCIAAISLLYPELNPILLFALTDNQIPFAEDLAWLFWTALPFLFNLVFAFGASFALNYLITRRRKAA